MKKKTLLLFLGAFIITCLFIVSFQKKEVKIKATLGGTVTKTIQEGAEAKEGSAIIYVRSLTGEAVAARAIKDGIIKKVIVKRNDVIKPKDEVAIIEEK